ncbi:MAG: hypothetical protein AA931_11600 [Peptococcaceae bacterium 1109]|nr:MAG: hypothetical protein AA931_11600 [Peptococcaceae bacterium 1109]
MTRSQRHVLTLVLLAVTMMLTGCLGIWTSHYNVIGTVTEKDTGIPLAGALVTMGTRRAITDARGNFELKMLAAGQRELNVELDGYEPEVLNVDLTSNKTIDVGLASELPPFQEDSLQFFDWDWYDMVGDTVDYATLYYELDRDLVFGSSSSIELDRIVALVNGQPMEGEVGWDNGAVPLEMGENTFQIRVWDTEGYARSSALYTFYTDMDRLDLRVLMTWAGEADLDLHMFKRDPEEPNVFAHGNDDRHVYYSNQCPSDFGSADEENPIYEWDGWEYCSWESIILPVLTPGEYHIWIYPYTMYERTTGQLKVILNATSSTPTETTFDFSFDVDDEATEYYVITLRVDEDGEATLVEVQPEDYL